MATLNAFYSFNIDDIDLNWYARNYYAQYFHDNQNFVFNGQTYNDAFVVNGWDGVNDLGIAFLGPQIILNGAGEVTGGTVTAVGEFFWSDGDIWTVQGISVSASAIYQAALTSSNADELQIIASALSGNDQIYLSGFDDVMSGFNGNDQIWGYGGNDELRGGDGNDYLNGGIGNDTLIGGIGEDTASYDTIATGVTVNLALTTAQNTVGAGTDRLTGIESLNGGSGNDKLTGNAGANRISGGAGNDVLNGGAGADSMAGDIGNDTYFVSQATDIVTELAAQGIDTIKASITYSLVDTDGAGANGGNVERLTLAGAAAINGIGNALNNTVIGNNAANIITGGGGRDVMTGAGGGDTFDFNATTQSGKTATTRDIIVDFAASSDLVDLSTIDANGALAGNTAFTFLATKDAAFTGVAGELHYLSAGANTLVEGDTNGDLLADFQIQLNGILTLTVIDFVL